VVIVEHALHALCGEGLCIGHDSSDPVSPDYAGRFDYTGGRIDKVVFSTSPTTPTLMWNDNWPQRWRGTDR
jgi:hypothetical protein